MVRIPAGGPKTLKPFFILWVGQAFSLLGSQIVQFGLVWWLTQETGRATVLATASIVGFLPQVLLGPFVGVLVDRWNRRLTMIVADAAVALSTLVLAYLFWTGQAQIWQVYAILFLRALGGTFHWPAMQASMTLIVPQDQLTRTQGLNQMLNGGMNILSAPLGALLLSVLTMPALLSIDVFTAAIAILSLIIVVIPQPVRDESAGAAATARSFSHELVEGFRYLRGWTGLLILAGLAMLVNMVLNPVSTLMPLLVTNHFRGTAWHLGALEAAIGIGIIAGGLLLGVWGGFKKRIVTSLIGLAGLGLSAMLLGLTPSSLFFLGVGAMFLMGVMSSMTNGPIMATFQAVVAPEMQGRVFTLVGSLSALMSPVGLAIAGPLADSIGVRTLMVGAGVITMAAAAVGFFSPPLMEIERGHPAAPLAAQVENEDTMLPVSGAVSKAEAKA